MRGSPIDKLPERALVVAVQNARAVSRERKGAPQRVGGANLAYITTTTNDTFDWSGKLDGSVLTPGFGIASFLISLDALTARVPLSDISITVYRSTDGTNWSEYSYAQGIRDSYNSASPQMSRFLTLLQGADIPVGRATYSFQLFGEANTRAAFKVQAVSTDEVTISVTRVA